jgi:leader peptidase (prepilin peptidase)/N-methyltransferase
VDDWMIRALVALPFGLAVGSFMTVAVYRLPKGESVLSPRSRCPSCGAELRNRDNIPVLSWLLLRGRCHNCGARISTEYPLTELVTAALVVGAAIVYESVWLIVAVGALLSMMPAISLIDIRHHIIPNKLMYPSLIAFPAFLVVARLFGAPVDLTRAAIGFLAFGGGLFVVALISRGMGMGDVKLAALIGVVFGSLGLGYVGVAAGAAIVLGAVGAVVSLVIGRSRKSAIPFGPYLALGAVVAAFWGQQLADWYLDTFLS